MFWNIRCYNVRSTRGEGGKPCPKVKFPETLPEPESEPPANWPDTAQNILHNLDGQHEATYPHDCTYLSPPTTHTSTSAGSPRELSGTVSAPNPPGTSVPGTEPPWSELAPELPWNPAQNLPQTMLRNLPGTSLKPCPEPALRNLVPEPPRSLPGTRRSEAAPAPPRNLYWLRPHT